MAGKAPAPKKTAERSKVRNVEAVPDSAAAGKPREISGAAGYPETAGSLLAESLMASPLAGASPDGAPPGEPPYDI